jgi:hypothetical protein
VWQALNEELSPLGVTIVTVAMDAEADMARPWVEAAAPTHPSLIDRTHSLGGALGFVNVPMAAWINEQGVLVRPAESARIQGSAMAGAKLPDGLPPRIAARFELFKDIDRNAHLPYLAAIRDWAVNGANSEFALTPDEVVARSQPRSLDEARAAACFELGEHLRETSGVDAATPWWREAHRLQPSNWTYKRQAWTLETTAPGQPSDLIQEPTDRYEGNWLDDVVAQGGLATYTPAFSGER